MAGGLVRAGVQVEGHHHGATVHRRTDVLATEVVGHVAIEERGGDVAVERHTVSLNVEDIDGGRHVQVAGIALHAGEGVHDLGGGGLEGAQQTDQLREAAEDEGRVDLVHSQHRRGGNAEGDGEVQAKTGEGREVGGVLGRGNGRAGEGHERIAVRQAAQVDVASGGLAVHVPAIKHLVRAAAGIDRWAETKVDCFNRPLQLVQKDVILRFVDARHLTTVHANERKANTLNENIVNLWVNKDIVDVQLSSQHIGDLVYRRCPITII